MTKLYAHQEKAVSEAMPNLIRAGFHALFMQIGTGKSLTIIEIASRLRKMGRLDALIVVGPKSLAGTWLEQVQMHCAIPGYSFASFDSQAAKTNKWQSMYRVALSSGFPIVFFNTEAFQTMPKVLQDALSDVCLDRKVLLAIDESSTIKGPKAKRTLNLTKFGRRCEYRLIATGTELVNSVLDLYSQFEFLKEGFWGFRSFFFFKNYFAVLEERYLSGGRTFKQIVGFRKLNELQDKIAPFTSRALKKDCLDLPDKVYARMPVHLSGECERVYRELKRSLVTMLDSGEILTVANKMVLFGKFRQIVGGTLAGVGVIDKMPAKLAALMDELEDHNEQAIIWSCFTEEIDLLCAALASGGVSRFDGSVSQAGRDDAISRFRSGDSRLFVANPQAASQGLNLQHCHLEYWYSLPTSAQQYEQAEGRIHRSGQTEKCVYKQILAEGTVDYRLAQILAEKTDIMAAFRDGNVRDILEVI